jgi:hypothetical protein
MVWSLTAVTSSAGCLLLNEYLWSGQINEQMGMVMFGWMFE